MRGKVECYRGSFVGDWGGLERSNPRRDKGVSARGTTFKKWTTFPVPAHWNKGKRDKLWGEG